MKKLFLTVVLAAASLTASAQAYIGGELGFWRNSDANHTSFNIRPEVGYTLSDKWALGIGVGYNHNYKGLGEVNGQTIAGIKTNSIAVDPYARWTFAKFGPVSFMLDMGFGVNTYKVKGDYNSPLTGKSETYKGDAQVGWRIGVQPGVKVNLAKNIDFVAHLGFLGYQDADDDYCAYGENGFGFNLSSNNLTFGVVYNF